MSAEKKPSNAINMEEVEDISYDGSGSSSSEAVLVDEIQIVRSDFQPKNADYGFFTSHGGVSDGGALNVSIVVNDNEENVAENIRRAMAAIDRAPEDLCLLTS